MVYFVQHDDMGVGSYGQVDFKDLAPEGSELFGTQEQLDKRLVELERLAEKQLTEQISEKLTEEVAELEAIEAAGNSPKAYEYRDIWAEEGSALRSGSAQFSFGNGATGYMGIPVDAGWEVESMFLMASTYASTAKVKVELMDYSGPTPGSAASRAVASISLENARDGGGDTNNAYKIETFDEAVPVVGDIIVLGFITREVTGTVSNVRVGVRLRREVL